MGVGAGGGGVEVVGGVVVAVEGGLDGCWGVGLVVLEGFFEGEGEDGVGADFDVGVVALLEEGVGGGVEVDGVAEVFVPVVGGELVALELGAGEG